MSDILFKLGSTDYSKYVIKDTYEVNKEPSYESWQDGNFHEHRIYVRDRIKGKFDIIFFGINNTPYNNFKSMLNNYTNNRLTTMTCYVPVDAASTQIQAYVYVEAAQHAECSDGRIVNKMTIHFEEY